MSRLFLIPTPLGNINKDDAGYSQPPILNSQFSILNSLRHFIVENVRTARRALRLMGYTASFDDTVFFELNEHTPDEALASFLEPLAEGHDMGLMSEAGVPCIADPGARIVALAQKMSAGHRPILNSQFSIEIVPLVGPCSIILGLMGSGFNGQNFAFLGYLPFDAKQRQETLKRIEQGIFRHDQTQILIETPYRNNKLLAELATKMPPETLICVARDLTLPTQSIRVLPARQWLQQKSTTGGSPEDLNKHYCVFLLYKS